MSRPVDRVSTVGNLRARYANGWQFEVTQWDIKERDFGQPRNQFPPEALLLGSASAQDPVFRYYILSWWSCWPRDHYPTKFELF